MKNERGLFLINTREPPWWEASRPAYAPGQQPHRPSLAVEQSLTHAVTCSFTDHHACSLSSCGELTATLRLGPYQRDPVNEACHIGCVNCAKMAVGRSWRDV